MPAIFNSRFRSDNKVHGPKKRRCGATRKKTAIPNHNAKVVAKWKGTETTEINQKVNHCEMIELLLLAEYESKN